MNHERTVPRNVAGIWDRIIVSEIILRHFSYVRYVWLISLRDYVKLTYYLCSLICLNMNAAYMNMKEFNMKEVKVISDKK